MSVTAFVLARASAIGRATAKQFPVVPLDFWNPTVSLLAFFGFVTAYKTPERDRFPVVIPWKRPPRFRKQPKTVSEVEEFIQQLELEEWLIHTQLASLRTRLEQLKASAEDSNSRVSSSTESADCEDSSCV